MARIVRLRTTALHAEEKIDNNLARQCGLMLIKGGCTMKVGDKVRFKQDYHDPNLDFIITPRAIGEIARYDYNTGPGGIVNLHVYFEIGGIIFPVKMYDLEEELQSRLSHIPKPTKSSSGGHTVP